VSADGEATHDPKESEMAKKIGSPHPPGGPIAVPPRPQAPMKAPARPLITPYRHK